MSYCPQQLQYNQKNSVYPDPGSRAHSQVHLVKAGNFKRTWMLKLADESLKAAVVMKNIKQNVLATNKVGNLNQKI